MKDNTFGDGGGAKNYISGFEGSQAMPLVLLICSELIVYDVGRATLERKFHVFCRGPNREHTKILLFI
jgi:hypothetical protein